MDFVHYVYRKYPGLKQHMTMAHMKITPFDFIKKCLINSILFTIMLSFFAIFMLNQFLLGRGIELHFFVTFLVVFLIGSPIIFFLMFSMLIGSPLAIIRRRKKDIDKEVLFAGRYLLVKLNSGKPLLNSLIDASKSYGVGSKYFKEIVDDITLGMPLEEALQRAMDLSPSESFKKILFQINNALTLGVDVSTSLRSVLEDISSDQMTQIDEYSHKLNSLAMFYMLIAVVIPSLGLTIFVVVAGMVGFNINLVLYSLLWGGIVITQILFIHIFRSIRPNINF